MARSVLQRADEPQELIDFCLDQCNEDECSGTDGCWSYQCKRAELLGMPMPPKPKRGPYKKKEKPLKLPAAECDQDVIVLEDTPAIMPISSEQMALRKINDAIVALDIALEVIPSAQWTDACFEIPGLLRKIRREMYDHLVDWDAIAGGGLTPSTSGGV